MDEYKILISIDVGLAGGLAFFDVSERGHPSSGLLAVREMPLMKYTNKSGKEKNVVDLDKLCFFLEIPKAHGDKKVLVVFENIHTFPGQGIVSMGTLLEQKGMIRGLVKALGYDELAIEPKTWQKHFDMIPPKDLKGKSASHTKTLRKKWLKNLSLEAAKNLFSPEWVDKIGKNNGISDALLIGKWYLDT